MTEEVQLVILGWGLGAVSAGAVGLLRWIRELRHRRRMLVIVEHFFSGTELRNRGMGVTGAQAETAWQNEWREWDAAMVRDAVAVNSIRAANVSNLVNFPLLGFQGVSAQMRSDLSQLTETLLRLSVFVSL